jgi:NTE family protein
MRGRAAITAGLVVATGCAHFPENQPLATLHPSRSLAEMSAPEASRDIFVLLAFSGGGTRAAALAYGVLEELRDTPVEIGGERRRLLDEVDLISGVSGGSFTAAYYGLFGERVFENFEERFLRRNVQSDLVRRVFFNPVNWFRLGSARFTRSDLAAEYYDEKIFEGKTIVDFGAVPGPAILINATDLMRGDRFSFIREQFDPICSDLLTYPVARAVAASSAVPGLLTPIRLRSYAGSCGYQPPEWVTEALATEGMGTRRYIQARVAASYVDPNASSSIFLVDGGVTDNLGIRGPFDRVIQQGSLDAVLTEAGYGGAHAILLIVANAQNEPDLDLENKGNFFQSLALMAGITSGIQIRRFNFETLDLVRTSFERWADRLSSPGHPFTFHMAEVSFSQVRDPERRRVLNNLPTSFVLDDEAVDELREAAREVLRSSEDFQGFLGSLKAEGSGVAGRLAGEGTR